MKLELELSNVQKVEAEASLNTVSTSQTTQLSTVQTTIQSLQTSLENATTQINSLNHSISEKEISLTVTKQRLAELEGKLFPLETQVSQLTVDNTTLRSSLDATLGDKERLSIHSASLEATIKVQSASLTDLQAVNARHRDTILDLESRIGSLNTEKFAKLRELEIALSSAQTSTSSIEEVKTHFVTEITTLEEKVTHQTALLEDLRSSNHQNIQTISTLESTITSLTVEKESKTREFESTITSLRTAATFAEQKKTRLEAEIVTLQKTLDSHSTTLREFRVTVATQQKTISSLESKLTTIVSEKETTITALNATLSQTSALVSQRDTALKLVLSRPFSTSCFSDIFPSIT